MFRRTAYATVLAALLAVPGTALAAEQRLLAGDGAENDLFGDSVAVQGNSLVVGAFNDDGGRGALYVFRRSGNTWLQTGKLTASDGVASDRLGTSVAIDGDTIVAGAPGDESTRGAVYTFAAAGAATRTETAKLTASDALAADQLGDSVAIDGDTIVAGARFDDVDGDMDQGSAYTFARTGAAARTETAKLTASDGDPSDFLGTSVAIEEDVIVAGAPNDNGANANEGSAYTFAATGAAARSQTAKLTAVENTAFADDSLGYSVAIDGDTIVAGAPFDNLGANSNQGSVLTFDRTGAAARSNTARLSASDGAADDHLGFAVAIDGNTIVAGARNEGPANQGAAYRFAHTGAASRNQTSKLTASAVAAGDMLGTSVAIDGGTIVAGAPFDTIGTEPTQGSASVFFAPALSVPPVTQPVADRIPPSLSGLRLSRTRFRAGRGGTLSFRLSEAARVAARIERKLRGRRWRRRCVKQTRRNARRRRCTRYARAGTFTRASTAGLNRVTFTGRIGRRKLRPGSYRVTLTPIDAAGNRGKPRRLSFRVVR